MGPGRGELGHGWALEAGRWVRLPSRHQAEPPLRLQGEEAEPADRSPESRYRVGREGFGLVCRAMGSPADALPASTPALPRAAPRLAGSGTPSQHQKSPMEASGRFAAPPPPQATGPPQWASVHPPYRPPPVPLPATSPPPTLPGGLAELRACWQA